MITKNAIILPQQVKVSDYKNLLYFKGKLGILKIPYYNYIQILKKNNILFLKLKLLKNKKIFSS
jgi:hypothetical protein